MSHSSLRRRDASQWHAPVVAKRGVVGASHIGGVMIVTEKVYFCNICHEYSCVAREISEDTHVCRACDDKIKKYNLLVKEIERVIKCTKTD